MNNLMMKPELFLAVTQMQYGVFSEKSVALVIQELGEKAATIPVTMMRIAARKVDVTDIKNIVHALLN